MRLPPFLCSKKAMACQADVRRSGEMCQADWEEKCLVAMSGDYSLGIAGL